MSGGRELEIETALSEGRAEDERWHIRRDDSRFFASGIVEPVRDDTGRLRGFAKVARDVTERKRAEEALREGERWLRLAQEAASAGTWEWDLLGGGIRWSEEHRELFGFDAEEQVTREEWFSTIHPDDVGRVEEAWEACRAGEEEVQTECRVNRVGGTTWWADAHGRMMRDGAGRPARVLGITVDVTGRKRAEEERDRLLAREAAAHAEAEERKRIGRELHDRVAYLMAVVRQSLELHRAFEERDPEKAAEKLELAERVTGEAMASVRDLSRVLGSTEAAGGLRPALSGLLREHVPAGVNRDLVVEGDETLVGLGARDQLFLILREAVRNAAAHSGAGAVSVRLTIDDAGIFGVVEDDGRGIDPEKARRTGPGGLLHAGEGEPCGRRLPGRSGPAGGHARRGDLAPGRGPRRCPRTLGARARNPVAKDRKGARTGPGPSPGYDPSVIVRWPPARPAATARGSRATEGVVDTPGDRRRGPLLFGGSRTLSCAIPLVPLWVVRLTRLHTSGYLSLYVARIGVHPPQKGTQ